MNKRPDTQIQEAAKRIADELEAIDTDYRGDLLAAVSTRLKAHGQHFTANVVQAAAARYGLSGVPIGV